MWALAIKSAPGKRPTLTNTWHLADTAERARCNGNIALAMSSAQDEQPDADTKVWTVCGRCIQWPR